MPISPLTGHEHLLATRAVAALRRTSASAAAGVATRQPDSVSLSDAARSLASARQAADGAPEIRAERIAEIKAAIASGTYTVDSRQLARTLVKRSA